MERRKPAILIVDDDPAVVLALGYRLTEAGCRVFFATSVEAALEAVATDEFDGALLNFHTPRMTGLELAERLRLLTESKIRTWPIWLMARKPTTEIYQRASELRIRNVFTSPIQIVALASELLLTLRSIASA